VCRLAKGLVWGMAYRLAGVFVSETGYRLGGRAVMAWRSAQELLTVYR
jgi:hypothetical protein